MRATPKLRALWSELRRRCEEDFPFAYAVERAHFPDRPPGDARPPHRRRAVAVLPFSDSGGAEATSCFGDGVMEDVLTRLSCCADLHVIARTSSLAFKDTSKTVAQIADELEVDAVLVGAIRRFRYRLRVVARLVDATSGEVLWAETYNRELRDIFIVQSQMAESVIRALGARPRLQQLERIRRIPTHDLGAYDLFLQGRRDVYRNRAPDLHRGIRQLERAVQLDPDFAAAHAMVAIAYLASPCFAGAPSRMALPRARDAARRSLELDECQGLAWVAGAGVKYHYEWDWAGAEEDFARAAELDPNLPDLHLWCGLLLILLERLDEASTWLDRGLALDPHSSLMAGLLGFARHLGGHREEGLQVLRAAAQRDPGNYDLEHIQGWCFMDEQRFLEAAEAFGAGVHLTDGHPYLLAARAIALHYGGLVDRAAGLVSAIRESTPSDRCTPMLRAYLALVDGDRDAAVRHLWAAADQRSGTVLWFRAVQLFRRALGDHPGWHALLHRIWPSDFPTPPR